MTTTETKWERIARQRAEYASYLETTTDEPKLSAAEFASAQHTARIAAASAKPAAEVKAAPVSAEPHRQPKRVDRVWGGGDRDSDDITYRR